MKASHFAAVALVACCLTVHLVAQNRPADLSRRSTGGAEADWPQWRGPNRDGAIASFTAPNPWPEKLNRKWKVEVGLGYATPVVIRNRGYMCARQGEEEVLGALDADTGKVLWRTAYPAAFTIS